MYINFKNHTRYTKRTKLMITNSFKPNGEFICNICGAHIDFDEKHISPICPTCGSTIFVAHNSETYLT